ncbi:MAG: hypothetical protein WAZ14_04660 [Patescibacteria group bacterium]
MSDSGLRKPWWKRLIVPVLVLLLLSSIAAGVYLFLEMQTLKTDSDTLAAAEVDRLIMDVGKLIVLPTDETPTVATVADPERLRDQTFFANAKTGDRVLLYTNAKKAILYDPVANKIVEVAPISLGADTGSPLEPDVAGASAENEANN